MNEPDLERMLLAIRHKQSIVYDTTAIYTQVYRMPKYGILDFEVGFKTYNDDMDTVIELAVKAVNASFMRLLGLEE